MGMFSPSVCRIFQSRLCYHVPVIIQAICSAILKNLTNFYEILYGCYVTEVCIKRVIFNFLQMVILTTQMIKLVRWDNDHL
jgi:hypothetical protein